MGLFDKRSTTVEELLTVQVAELKARTAQLEQELREARKEHQAKLDRWLAQEQDLIETICLLKGIPVPHDAEDKGAPANAEEKPTPSHQRLTWPQRIAKLERLSRDKAAAKQPRVN